MDCPPDNPDIDDPDSPDVLDSDGFSRHCSECDCLLDDDEDDFCDECFTEIADELP